MEPPATTPGGEGPEKKPSDRDRDLIREALEQASPREGSRGVIFPGDLPPSDAFPNYEILREVHRGGQGVVYQAIQKTTRRKVAIKVLHGGPFTGSTGRSRFEREVQVLGQLSHPNIVRIHDSGATPDGSFFYVMDYISGRPLDEHLADRRPTIDDTLTLFAKICDAVNAAHLKGVIHRDLKPSNIRMDANGEPIVVDFGLAKIAVPDVIEGEGADKTPHLMTLTGQFIGSLPWASPEQAEGLPGNIDVRTDVYSLGVILYQMLTGQFPYKVIGNMRDVLDNILRAEPAKPSTIRRQVDDEVETIVLKCLSKDRERRYQSAGELGRDIRHYLQGEPIEAKRDSTAYMLAKALRRYRGVAVAAAAVLVMLVVFSVAMTLMYGRERDAQVRATDALSRMTQAQQAEAAQRARAERNFKAGHALAMAMLTDFNREITYLRGATRAREMLVKEAQAYLTRLETEAGDDPDLLLDLARAYEQVGDLQGVIYMRRLGETAQAELNHARALEIRRALAARLPTDPRVHAALARSHYRAAGAAQLRSDLTRARESHQAALAAYDTALRLAGPDGPHPVALWADGRSWTARALGDVYRLQARDLARAADMAGATALLQQAHAAYTKAEIAWKARVAADPGDEDAQRGLGVIIDARAAALLVTANALSASAAKLKADDKPEEARGQWAAALLRVAEARTLSESALKHFESLAASNSASGEVRRHVMVSNRNVALSYSESARIARELAALPGGDAAAERAFREQALAFHERSAHIARRLGDEDTRSLEARRDLAGCLNDLGNELRALGRLEPALAALTESLSIRAQLEASDPLERHTQDHGVGLMRLGQFHLERAKAPDAADRAGHLTAAEIHLSAARARFKPLADAKVVGASGQLDEVDRLIAEVGAARPPPR
jgi:tetratricopeptide (TPR) repeat protein